MFDTQTTACRNDTQAGLARLVERLTEAGLRVVRSFDAPSQWRHLANSDCTDAQCPHRAQSSCEHHLIVLLVYGTDRAPVTLLSQGCDRHSQFSIAGTLSQPVDSEMEAAITAALARTYSRFDHSPKISRER